MDDSMPSASGRRDDSSVFGLRRRGTRSFACAQDDGGRTLGAPDPLHGAPAAMVPFRVIDQDSKQMWIVLNYHPGTSPGDNGTYLVAKQDDEERDLPMQLV